ncbi:hypothetical protein, partial [Escherichia coli]|uniref:hypothetical protein n=1 Tax=Escherichia coli TaxID=562 RepID=UPI001BDC8129
KNLQAITVSTNKLQYIEFIRLCRPDKAFTPHPEKQSALCKSFGGAQCLMRYAYQAYNTC